jgi:hypothetical protein
MCMLLVPWHRALEVVTVAEESLAFLLAESVPEADLCRGLASLTHSESVAALVERGLWQAQHQGLVAVSAVVGGPSQQPTLQGLYAPLWSGRRERAVVVERMKLQQLEWRALAREELGCSHTTPPPRAYQQ